MVEHLGLTWDHCSMSEPFDALKCPWATDSVWQLEDRWIFICLQAAFQTANSTLLKQYRWLCVYVVIKEGLIKPQNAAQEFSLQIFLNVTTLLPFIHFLLLIKDAVAADKRGNPDVVLPYLQAIWDIKYLRYVLGWPSGLNSWMCPEHHQMEAMESILIRCLNYLNWIP